MLRQKVIEAITRALGTDRFRLLTPKDPTHGDYAIHAASVESSKLQVTSNKVAELLSQDHLFQKVDQKGDFINFFLHPRVLIEEVGVIVEQKDSYGLSKQEKSLRINLEYGDPNTHKLPHVGHLFSYIIGESWARMLEASGHTVYRCNYQGDVGLHVAKSLYQVTRNKAQETNLKTLETKVQFLQKCYQEGSKLYEEDEKAKQEIDMLNKKIYEQEESIKDLWRTTRKWSLDYYKEFETRLGITYDKHYFESMIAQAGKKIVLDHVNGIFEKSDGAIVFRGEKHGLHTRVFVTKHGNPTYEAKDLGLAELKYKDWKFDKAIITTASEQNAYFKVVIKAIDEVIPKLKGKVSHIGFGLIDLKMGKMSSRTGTIISAVDLVEDVKREILTVIDRAGKKENDIDTIAETVALGAIKYSFLRSEAKKNIAFDIKESISLTGNSGPYLQYTYARATSVLRKVDASRQSPSLILPLSKGGDTEGVQSEELALLRTLFRFPEVVDDAAAAYAPHLVCTYLYDLAANFNFFYEKQPILKAQKDERTLRLALTEATAQLLKSGLRLLGIEVLEKI